MSGLVLASVLCVLGILLSGLFSGAETGAYQFNRTRHSLALAEGLAVQCEQDFFVTSQNQCQACPAGQVHDAGTCTNGPATACSVVPTSAPSASPSASPSAAAVLCSPGEEQARRQDAAELQKTPSTAAARPSFHG